MMPGQEIRGLATGNEIIYQEKVKIYSNASRVIGGEDNIRIRHVAILKGPGSTQPQFGILMHYEDYGTIWSVKMRGMKIGIGLNNSVGTRILNTFISEGGDLFNGKADPSIWISSSNFTTVDHGHMIGRANGPGGDGEISAYNSIGVVIKGTHVTDSGASAIYMVNCDSCKVEDTYVWRADEWGIDIVGGSDNFIGRDNVVGYSNFGGSVFDEEGSVFPGSGSAEAIWDGNSYYYNSAMGVGSCDGINVIGNPNNISLINNTSTGQVSCTY